MKVLALLLLTALSLTSQSALSADAGEILLPPGSSYVVNETTITCMAAGQNPGLEASSCYGIPSSCLEAFEKAPVSEMFIRGSTGLSRCQIRQCTNPAYCWEAYRVFIDGRAQIGDWWQASKEGVVKDLLRHIKNKRCD